MEKLCLKLELLMKIQKLVADGNNEEALKLLNDICDVAFRKEVNEAKRACYKRLQAGVMTYEEFRESYDKLSSLLP